MRYEYNTSMNTFFEREEGILSEHWEQLAGNKDKIKLKPDVNKYQMLQEVGMLFNIIAYKEEELIGYSIILISPNLHYMDDKFAMVDVIFVKANSRVSRAGIDLINKTEEVCRKEGVSMLSFHTKPSHSTIEKILYRKGFKHCENILGKLLKE